MRYLQTIDPAPEYGKQASIVSTFSEDELKGWFWPYWSGEMTERFGGEYTLESHWNQCLSDFYVVNWAWEIKEEEL